MIVKSTGNFDTVSVYDSVCWFPRFNSHVQSVQHEVGSLPGANRPARNLPRIHVQDTTALGFPLPGGVLRDVGAPQLVGGCVGEIAFHEVFCRDQVFTGHISFPGPGNTAQSQAGQN